MNDGVLSGKEVQEKSLDELLKVLSADLEGLTSSEATKRLERYGPNMVEETAENPLLKFLGYFWGPIPWMIEIAALLSGVLQHWTDLVIILTMLVFNAVIGFWQEHQASNALEALKGNLALEARCPKGRPMAKDSGPGSGSRRHHPPSSRRHPSGGRLNWPATDFWISTSPP